MIYYILVAITLMFTTLKLTGTVAWSWFWITAPIWIGFPTVLIITFMFALLLVYIADKYAGGIGNVKSKMED